MHAAVSGEPHALTKQLSPLLVRAFGKIRRTTIRSDHALRQPLMAVVCRTSEQRADRLVVVVYAVAAERYLSIGRYAPCRNALRERRHELLPIHP